MKATIFFIHGMFQNAKSWGQWTRYFGELGYECIAESWPLHVGEPGELRRNPPAGLGDLRLQTIIDRYASLIESRHFPPIVIGHSVGGLITQKLVERGLASAGVAICSVAPNRMLAVDWGFFRNSVQITNPLVGDSIFEMTPEGFHQNFANTLSAAESSRAFEQFATHDSRNVLRDCMLEAGEINLSRAAVPLMFVSADKDEIIPPQLCEKNAQAYVDAGGSANYEMFKNRSHYICGEPGWQEVAASIDNWIGGLAMPAATRRPVAAMKSSKSG